MTLTLGSGPFGHHPGGAFNAHIDGPAHTIWFEDFPRRVRAVLGGQTVIDTTRGKLLHESSHLPVLYVPLEDVRQDLIERTDHTTHCPFKGDAAYWTVRAGDRVAENALWGYPEPVESAPWLRGYVAAYRDAMDAWYEEDERVQGLRDPYHRVDVRSASGRVTVRAGGRVIAQSDRPKLVFETGLPPRPYIPLEDVSTDLLEPSETTTFCPYKGTATYWSLRSGDRKIDDAVWTYSEPLPESAPIAGHVSFHGEGIEVELDRDAARDGALAA